MHGAPSTWTTEAHLLAAAVDALQIQIWQQSKKGTPRPQPIPRPGVSDPTRKQYGNQKMTVADYEQYKQARKARKEAVASGD
jgi:hypothetical protein